MFRIRRILDTALQRNASIVRQAQDLLRKQFPEITEAGLGELSSKLQEPYRDGFRYILFVADEPGPGLKGLALLSYHPDPDFCYLDYLAASIHSGGRGVGGALYEAVREEALDLGSIGLFFQCLPDDPALVKDQKQLRNNIARMRFYERYRAYPVTNTSYEAAPPDDPDNQVYLMFDGLDRDSLLARHQAQEIVRTILRKKYGSICPPHYVEMVADSFRDDPVRLRSPRYTKDPPGDPPKINVPATRCIALVVNDRHNIHHVRERGYVESPVRVQRIVNALADSTFFRQIDAWHYPERHITAVHDREYVNYLKRACEQLPDGKLVYPQVFPLRNQSRPPEDLSHRVGYYCIDTFTPLSRNAYLAARRAVDCALTAAEAILDGHPLAYALIRPPGHHAERNSFGGFCYFNNCAIAAQFLSPNGRVAILDIDYHHGNGQQNIFYERSDVLTVSIHAHPRFEYPLFAGFDDETGDGDGRGYNLNIPLPQGIVGERYRIHLRQAIRKIVAFRPDFLIVALGLDTAKGDPTGTWLLRSDDFELNGSLIGNLRLPTVIIQEGGYRTSELGKNAARFFRGLWEASRSAQ